MKVSTFFLVGILVTANLLLANPGRGQKLEKLITLNLKQKTFKEIFIAIERQADVTIMCELTSKPLSERTSIRVKEKRLGDVLNDLLQDRNLKWTIREKIIRIEDAAHIAAIQDDEPKPAEPSPILEIPAVKVSGTVIGINNSPLAGATISVKGKDIVVVSDANGKFSIDVLPNSILVFSYVGYATKEVNIADQVVIDVKLIEENQQLNSIVVIGYGTQKKVNVIGSVATVSNKELEAAPVASMSNALSGRLPGVVVMQRTGEPGNDDASILVRGRATLGNNSPLIVVDGVPGRDLNSLNAADVESISVLKDASAAIYGARAANGVILVTTKKGKSNSAPVLNYSAYEGRLSPTDLPEMASAATYAEMIRETQLYSGIDPSNMLYSETDIEKFRSGSSPWTHPNTNWFDATLRRFSVSRNHDLSVAGGGNSVRYYAGFGTQYDNGIYKSSSAASRRYNLKLNLNVDINKYLTVGLNTDAIQYSNTFPAISTFEIFRAAMRSRPTVFAVFPNGFPGPDIEAGWQPVVLPTDAIGFNKQKIYRIYNTLSANLKIPWIDGLSLSSFYSYDVNFKQGKLFEKPYKLYSLDVDSYLAAGNTGTEDGSAFLLPTTKGPADPRLTNSYSDGKSHTFNFKINYDKSFNSVHNINVFAAYENSEDFSQGTSAYRRGFITDRFPYLFAGSDLEKDNSEFVQLDARINYFGRISYNYKEKYLFQAAFRRDGSLRFSKQYGRWGNFPSVLAGWIISKENFWANHMQAIDFLKLKFSWAQMGNDLVDPFQYLTTYEFNGGIVTSGNREFIAALNQSGVANPAITWEVANVYNAGFESLLFNNRLSFNADFFYQRRNKILVRKNASVPIYTGITLPDENFGIVDSRGFEMELGYNQGGKDFSYGIDAHMAFARNKIIEFDESKDVYPNQRLTGHPQGATLLYEWLGVFKDEAEVNAYPHVSGARPGDLILKDNNKDGVIDVKDRVLFDKTAIPEITFGASFHVEYKNWGVSGLVQGVGSVLRKVYYYLQGVSGNYFQYDAEGRWTPSNTSASKPRTFDRENEYWRSSYPSDYWYHDGTFARMKNLQLTYSLPFHIAEKMKLKSVQLSLSGQNLFFLYRKEKIIDPEVGDVTDYPLMKTYAAGIRITL